MASHTLITTSALIVLAREPLTPRPARSAPRPRQLSYILLSIETVREVKVIEEKLEKRKRQGKKWHQQEERIQGLAKR
jgi:hypothetical protein